MSDVFGELQSMGWIFAVVAVAGVAVSGIINWIAISGTRRVQQRQAHLLSHSSVFWSRWPGERVWIAPYDELAAEAARCEQIIDIVRQRAMLATPRFPTKRDQLFLRYLDNQIADSRRLLDVVNSAMHYAVSQGRGPQQPHFPA